jgi:GNAT superfamily N-acetyltransferase
MGVDRRYEGQGFGRWLVVNALMRVYRQDVIAAYALIVDSKEGVRDFYLNTFGFIPLVNNPNRLFLHLQPFVDTLAAPPSP